ncbi:DUF4886 domain-containing protein [[Muricauda] lutisoli]|uniref:DUF4886 domain-containing protein n=1 Tax=[Muricauda] lutisoli TaxID=2816035 RepID=A0ABS3EUD0_9FLAO|nr:DUF4886 domain-containing protein [[Muricauda] lutisoli]MBO0329839.1 DUF4886 domain-containing protein [[Muricauda] lutisoli]
MKNILLLVFLVISVSCKSQETRETEKINVLFIGNSLTYYHDMPETLQKMLNETASNFNIEQSTFPGMSLDWHLNNIIESRTEDQINTRRKTAGEKTETEIKLSEKDWDVVILQEGTVRLLIPEAKAYKVETAIEEIKNRISNPNCEFILFKTWPSKKEYPKQYCYSKWAIDHTLENDEYCSPEIANLEQEMALINESYDLLAEKYELTASDNGNKFYEILTEYPELSVYGDNIHPNTNGAFLNACIFYQMLTGKKASGLKFNGEIEPKTAGLLKKIAE